MRYWPVWFITHMWSFLRFLVSILLMLEWYILQCASWHLQNRRLHKWVQWTFDSGAAKWKLDLRRLFSCLATFCLPDLVTQKEFSSATEVWVFWDFHICNYQQPKEILPHDSSQRLDGVTGWCKTYCHGLRMHFNHEHIIGSSAIDAWYPRVFRLT